MTNSTLTGNAARAFAAVVGGSAAATSEGGGVSILGAPMRLTNATVARNTVASQGALITSRGGGLYANSAAFELRGTLLAANEAPDGLECSGTAVASLGWNLDRNDLRLQPRRPRVRQDEQAGEARRVRRVRRPDADDQASQGQPGAERDPEGGLQGEDQRGVKRPKEKRCEIGAWERRP